MSPAILINRKPPSLFSGFFRLADIREGEGTRLLLLLTLLFLLLAANTIIKVVRDSIFLSQHATAELPYVYLYSGILAGVSIAIYGRYTSGTSLYRLMMGSLCFITLSVLGFWYLLRFYNAGWVHYAFYVWASIVIMVAVAQLWTLAEELFTPREGKRLFGLLTTGGTLGSILAAFGVRWIISMHVTTVQLLWLVAALLGCAIATCHLASSRPQRATTDSEDDSALSTVPVENVGVVRLLRNSPYLLKIGALIFISVIVSTLLDFQFKVAAKESYASAEMLAHFFASYYGWVSLLTLFAGFALTGQLVALIGLYPSLFILPLGLFVGSFGLLIFPGLVLATLMRMSDAGLRPTYYRSLVEMLYFPIPIKVKTKAKTFLDVVAERLGDGSAGFIILFFSLAGVANSAALVFCCMTLTLGWLALLPSLRRGYLKALHDALATRQIKLLNDDIDYSDKVTLEAIEKLLTSSDEPSILLGLEFAERVEPRILFARLPRDLLRHPGSRIQNKLLQLLANSSDQHAADEFLAKIITKETVTPIVRKALAVREHRIDLRQIDAAIRQLQWEKNKRQARDILTTYGEAAVAPLRAKLFDGPSPREIRLNIPRTLSKLDSQSAMDTLLAALEHEDGGIRYKVFLALEEMARRFPHLRLSHGAIETAIVADTVRYYKRFVSYHVLFNGWEPPPIKGSWLLHQALLDSMERIKQRAVYLLSLLYPPSEINPLFAALQAGDPMKKAFAVELLDNLLTGKVKRHLFALFEDAPPPRQYQKFVDILGWPNFTAEKAIFELLRQEDPLLTAATLWEIGVRRLGGFDETIRELGNSDNPLLRETAELVLAGIPSGAPTQNAVNH